VYILFLILVLGVLFGGFVLYFVEMLIGRIRGEYYRAD
jgi:hypothetical protein